MAQGSSYGTGQAVAREQRRAMDRNRTEAINQGVTGFALGSTGLGLGTLQNVAQLEQSQRFGTQQQLLQQYAINQNQPELLDYLSAPIGAGLGYAANLGFGLLGGLLSPASGGGGNTGGYGYGY